MTNEEYHKLLEWILERESQAKTESNDHQALYDIRDKVATALRKTP